MLDSIKFEELREKIIAERGDMDEPGRYAAEICRNNTPADIAEVLVWCLSSDRFEYFDKGLSFYEFVVTGQDYIPGDHEVETAEYLNGEGKLPEIVERILSGDCYVKAERILLYPELLRALGLTERLETYYRLYLEKSPLLLKHLFGYRFVDDGGRFPRDWYDEIVYDDPFLTRCVRLTIMESQAVDTVTEEELLAKMKPVGHAGLDRETARKLEEVKRINQAGDIWSEPEEPENGADGDSPDRFHTDLTAGLLFDYYDKSLSALETGEGIPDQREFITSVLAASS
jgi:hypothetical protein